MTKQTYDRIPNYIKTTIAVLLFGGACMGVWLDGRDSRADIRNSLEKQIISCNARHEASRVAQAARELKLHEENVRLDERGTSQLQTYVTSFLALENEVKHLSVGIHRMETLLLENKAERMKNE